MMGKVVIAGAARRLIPRPKYPALALMSLQQVLVYRGAVLMSILTNLVWLIMLFYLWQTVFAARPRVSGFDWEQMRTYLLLAYAVNALLSFTVEIRMISPIRTGQVAVELLRPIDYLLMQLAQVSGAAIVEGVISSLLALGLGLLIFDLPPPASLVAGLLFSISVVVGFLVKFLISYLTGLLCFWTLNGLGLLWARAAITNIFSGAVIPIAFFPEPLQTLALVLPFQTIVATPVSIYLGRLDGLQSWRALGVQVLWALMLWVLARWLWRPASRVLTVQGG